MKEEYPEQDRCKCGHIRADHELNTDTDITVNWCVLCDCPDFRQSNNSPNLPDLRILRGSKPVAGD